MSSSSLLNKAGRPASPIAPTGGSSPNGLPRPSLPGPSDNDDDSTITPERSMPPVSEQPQLRQQKPRHPKHPNRTLYQHQNQAINQIEAPPMEEMPGSTYDQHEEEELHTRLLTQDQFSQGYWPSFYDSPAKTDKAPSPTTPPTHHHLLLLQQQQQQQQHQQQGQYTHMHDGQYNNMPHSMQNQQQAVQENHKRAWSRNMIPPRKNSADSSSRGGANTPVLATVGSRTDNGDDVEMLDADTQGSYSEEDSQESVHPNHSQRAVPRNQEAQEHSSYRRQDQGHPGHSGRRQGSPSPPNQHPAAAPTVGPRPHLANPPPNPMNAPTPAQTQAHGNVPPTAHAQHHARATAASPGHVHAPLPAQTAQPTHTPKPPHPSQAAHAQLPVPTLAATPATAPAAAPAPRPDSPEQAGPVKHYTPEFETQESLKRERTRIMQRTVVSTYRQIDYRDIANIKPLKKGGFGEIHTAEWSRLQVVLKRALTTRGEGAEQFDHELEILKRVHDYDFIVPFYGVTTDPVTNVRCMVMKHCTNGNLCSFLEKNHDTLTWAERYRLSIEITKGLEFLHKSGFHHRDLHSGNILLDDKRTAMICDFGLSRSSTKEKTNDLSATVGVASFLAPERFPTKRPIYSAACDVYSLGVIFWHISSGRIPFAKRLRDPTLLKELMDGRREEIVPNTPTEYRDLLAKCWDVYPARRLKIEVIIAILQTLIAKPSEPVHQVPTGFMVPSKTTSAALPMPPDLSSKMSLLERAGNMLNKMVFDIKDPTMVETVHYIERTREFFRIQRTPPEPYSPTNPPQTPIYLCPLVGDIAALEYYLTSRQTRPYNPINESSEQTGDTALHLACLFLESPLDAIKVLVELGADINLENLQGYTPVMILVSSNTQHCYEALKFFVMRGARIPAYIQKPITPMNNAQIYAMNLVNESRQLRLGGSRNNGGRYTQNQQNANGTQADGLQVEKMIDQGRPLIHVVAAMQEDYRILDCLCEAGLDPAISYNGDTALIAAAAHLRIKNIEWLLNNDLDVSSEAAINRATKVVKMIHGSPGDSQGYRFNGSGNGNALDPKEFPNDIRVLGKYSWAGVAYSVNERFSKDMVGPVLRLLEQWSGTRLKHAREEVATKLKLMNQGQPTASPGSVNRTMTNGQNGQSPPYPAPLKHLQQSRGSGNNAAARQLSQRKNQRHMIDHVLQDKQPEKPANRFW
ncbi:hypothetical protein B0O80DRAFT_158881 [Mortierella sp. GBAus27b]|nr:hypothetical protein BGX31_002998 [Mortierella sp. GBA43]KAI8361433.1 hypothetical protein B0O80DRAFT_158881 [Mortierella sp. GBAus27b]